MLSGRRLFVSVREGVAVNVDSGRDRGHARDAGASEGVVSDRLELTARLEDD